MNRFEAMYDHTEWTDVRFIGFHTDHMRYDFGIVHTNHFYGNPLVINLQTGRAFLVNAFDASNRDWIKATFQVIDDEEVDALILFFKNTIPAYAYICEN